MRTPGSFDSVYDVVAIGCGPFNLGFAALASTVAGLDHVVFESQPELRWHPGLMFGDAKLQLSFLADLVTLIDPTHPLSFLAYLRDVDRMYAFYIREEFHPSRREYESYLRWVASKLSTVRFGHRVERVEWSAAHEAFALQVRRPDGADLCVLAKHVLLGIGTEPALPEALAHLPPDRVFHSAAYLHRQDDLALARHVTVIGSGQSGAECALDLLRRNLDGGPAVSWLTRTRSFTPLDYTKLVLEMTTPAYIEYFHALPQDVKDKLVAEQWHHYKGISAQTLADVHDALYQREVHETMLAPVELRFGTAVEAATIDGAGQVVLTCRHRDSGETFAHRTSLVIAATGYRERRPTFLAPIEPLLRRDARGRYRVRLDHSVELAGAVTGKVFVANADLHSHGVAAPDLGICAYRNATILNAIMGREVYRLPKKSAYTSFAVPAARASASATGRLPLPEGVKRRERRIVTVARSVAEP